MARYPTLAEITSSSTLRSFMNRSVPKATYAVVVDPFPAVIEEEILEAAVSAPEPIVLPVPAATEIALGSIGAGSSKLTIVFLETQPLPQLVLTGRASIRWDVEEYLQLREIVINANAQIDRWHDDGLITGMRIESEDLVLRRHDLGMIETNDGAIKFTLARTEEETAFLSIEGCGVKLALGRDELNDLEELIVRADRLFRLVPVVSARTAISEC